MSNDNLWYGYLDAGEKSSPVIMDAKLDTANPATVYLFNFKRGEIIEYRRDIIEAKLRTLESPPNPDETTLKSAYTVIRDAFTPRGAQMAEQAEKNSTEAIPKKRAATIKDREEEMLAPLIDNEVSVDDDWGDD